MSKRLFNLQPRMRRECSKSGVTKSSKDNFEQIRQQALSERRSATVRQAIRAALDAYRNEVSK